MTHQNPRPDDDTLGQFLWGGGQDTEPLGRIPDWDGRTIHWAGASGPGQPRPQPWPPPPAPVTVVSVTVSDSTSGGDMASARIHAALTYIRLKVAILEREGHADRIDHSEHARRRGDPVGPRSTVGEIRREATALLLGAGIR